MAEHEAIADELAQNVFTSTSTPAVVVRVVAREDGQIITDTGFSEGMGASVALSCAEAIVISVLKYVRGEACGCEVCAFQINAAETVLAVFEHHRKRFRTDG